MAEEDKYEVLEKIGHGSFGVIRRVRRKCDGQILCRKEISYTKMSQKEREQLQAELSILKELRHPNIVQYYEREHLKATQDLHLYMEYCGNGDLGRLIKNLKAKNQFAEEEFVWSVFSQLVTALYRCHYGQNPPDIGHDVLGLGNTAKPLKSKQALYMILHRDLKPENVFLGEDNSVKLGDFGLSKILQSHDFASTYVGTPFYMSPEICGAERYTLHSDIWSLGCILYELCAKEPPFNAKTHLDLIQKIKSGRVPRIPHIYSSELQKVIDSCLQVNPSHRPDTAQLLNLPIAKLMRKEQEVVNLAQRMKLEKEQASRALKELNNKMQRLESENENIRLEIDASLRREWEVKARLEIDRQVKLEMDRLQQCFEAEINKRVSQEVERRMALIPPPTTAPEPEPVRSLTPTIEVDHPASAAIDIGDIIGKTPSTLGSSSDFPTLTDISTLSLESPEQPKPSFAPMRRPTRTPFTRAQTMFNQGPVLASPMDVQMAEPSPVSVGALSLSPRRLPRGRNLFAAQRLAPTVPSSPSFPASDDEDAYANGPEYDELPTLPSPTRNNAKDDPFNPTPSSRPNPVTNKIIGSTPNLLAGHNVRARTQNAIPSPRRHQSKMAAPSITGSPQRKAGQSNLSGAVVPSATGNTSANTFNLKKGHSAELRQQTASKNPQLQGRTLIELSHGKAPNGQLASGSGHSSESEDGVKKERRDAARKMVAEWDPERDDMPSPFLVRGSKMRGILPIR